MFLSRVELGYLIGAAALSAMLLVAPSYAAQRPKVDAPATAKQVSSPASAEAARRVRVVYPNPNAGR